MKTYPVYTWYTRECKICGEEFTTKHKHQYSCSKKCGIEARTYSIDINKARKLYESGLSLMAVGKIVGCSDTCLLDKFRQNNIKTRGRKLYAKQ